MRQFERCFILNSYFTVMAPNLVFSSVVKLHSNSIMQLNMTLTCLILIHPLTLGYLPICLCMVDHLTVSLRNGPSPIIIQQTETTRSSAHIPNFMFCSCLHKHCPQPHPETATKWTVTWVFQFRARTQQHNNMLLSTGSVFAGPFTFANTLLRYYFLLCHHIWQRDFLQKKKKLEME